MLDTKVNKDSLKINEEIRAKEIRLIDESGEMIGIFQIKEAIDMAFNSGLDLVEINPESKPPVCKILDYGKYKYQQQKRKQETKKKQKVILLKELYIHLGIGEHDYQVKLKQLRAFLQDDCKVKIGVKFRGREIAYSKKGIELLNRFYDDLGREQGAKLDTSPRLEGNNAIVIFAPLVVKPTLENSVSENNEVENINS